MKTNTRHSDVDQADIERARELVAGCVGHVIEEKALKISSVYYTHLIEALNILNRLK